MHLATRRAQPSDAVAGQRTRFATTGAVLALALLPSAALAATIDGGPGNERLRGTRAADTIDAGKGNDRVFGLGGNDVLLGVQGDDLLNGGRGDDQLTGDGAGVGDRTSRDVLYGAAGNDVLRGGDARDRVFGGSGNDQALGEAGNDLVAGGFGDDAVDGGLGDDVLFANQGVDTVAGGEGDDRLWALSRKDVAPGAVDQVGDTLDGGNGNDTLRTRDGEVDRVTCGAGTDTALLDQVDVLSDATAEAPNGSCETVVRAAPTAADAAAEDAREAPAAQDATA